MSKVILTNDLLKPVATSTLGKNQELMVFRILQEVINNALRHSQACHLSIQIDNTYGSFPMKLKGKGFDVANTLKSDKASGLLNIIRRAQLVHLFRLGVKGYFHNEFLTLSIQNNSDGVEKTSQENIFNLLTAKEKPSLALVCNEN